MADKTFECSVLTPEKAVLRTEATFAAIPAHDGEIGILHDRAPLLCELGIGILRLETPSGEKRLFIDAGFAEMRDNKLSVLTEQALAADQIDIEAERAAQAEARQRHAVKPEELESRRRDLDRAAQKLKLATTRGG